jgi:tetratricopeptide (TPR) repeat protein
MLAELELSEGRKPEASQAIQEILTISAGNAVILDALGRIYLETHHNDEAIAEFRAALALAPRNLDFWLHLSTAQRAAGRPTEAGEAASKALDVAPDSRPAIRAAVQAELRANHSDAALKRVSTASAAHPNDAALWELTGDVRAARKEFSLAQTAYDRASHINPSGTLAFKSFQARHAGGLARECEPLEQWVSEHPADADARGLLATAYESAGRPADAMREYETTLSHNPRHLLALNNLAWLYLKATDPRALATAERAYALAPNSPTIADTYGWALLQSGQAATGVKVLQHAASDNTNGAIQIHYATALVRTGDRENARRILTQVVAGNFRESDRSQAEHLLKDL